MSAHKCTGPDYPPGGVTCTSVWLRGRGAERPMTTVDLMNGKRLTFPDETKAVDFEALQRGFKSLAQAVNKATKKLHRFVHDFTNADILPEIRYLRLVARAEQAEAELHLERRMTEMYADLGLVRR